MNRHRRRHGNRRNRNLLPYKTICAATKGDVDAISAVLSYYASYITRMSTRKLYDKHGNVYLYVDEIIRRRLEIKLITGILTFRPV